MKLKKLNNKGSMLAWIVVLSVLFSTILVYVCMYPMFHETLPQMAEDFGVDPTTGTLAVLVTVFDNFPILLIFGMIVWAFISQQRKEPDSGYYS